VADGSPADRDCSPLPDLLRLTADSSGYARGITDAAQALTREQRSRTFAVILETGEEVMQCLQQFVASKRTFAAQLTAIGAFSDVVLLYFDWEEKDYRRMPIKEQVEVASLVGDVAQDPQGDPTPHIHPVIGRHDGSAMAGHLGEAHVRPNAGGHTDGKPGASA
jgi:predicted DNA-binding protein with PD1-like motif